MLNPLAGKSLRSWLVAGLCGALIVASISPFWDAWRINMAGITVNRVMASAALAATDEAAQKQQASDQPSPSAATVAAADPAIRAQLQKVMDSMESLASQEQPTAAREKPIWRTFGAAARLLPSTHAYEVLVRTRNAGRLDRIGELWLGEVAAATGNFEEAAKAYERIDASNLLIDRAETALEAGDKTTAAQQFSLAYDSLKAAAARTTAEKLLLDRTGKEPSATSQIMQQPAERVTSLYRIGRGFLNAGRPSDAVPVLEQALAAAETDSPGAVMQQSVHLALAMALAKTLPAASSAEEPAAVLYYAVDTAAMDRVRTLSRIRALVFQGTSYDVTASACVQAGKILLSIAEEDNAVSYLKRALELDPHLAESYLALGAYYTQRGAVSTARELYKRGTKVLPSNAALAQAYALAAYKSMPLDYALPLLEQATTMKGLTDPFVYAALGDCYLDLGQAGDARAAYDAGLLRFPGNETLTQRLAACPLSYDWAP